MSRCRIRRLIGKWLIAILRAAVWKSVTFRDGIVLNFLRIFLFNKGLIGGCKTIKKISDR